jgi:hypothetical protein
MGAGGHGFSFRNRSNTQINNRVAAKAAQRPVVEEVVNLNATPFASTIDSPSIDLVTPITVAGSRTEPVVDKDKKRNEYFEKVESEGGRFSPTYTPYADAYSDPTGTVRKAGEVVDRFTAEGDKVGFTMYHDQHVYDSSGNIIRTNVKPTHVLYKPKDRIRKAEADPDFNVADYYERMTARAEESITPKAVRSVLDSHDPGRGELYGTSPRGYLMDQQVGDPFIEIIRSKQIPLAKELDTPFELDYDYGYHSDKLYMKQPPLLGNDNLQQGFTDKERAEYRDLMKRGSFVDISGGTSRVGEYTMAWVEDPPEPSGFSKFLNNPVVNVLGAINPVVGLATTAAKAATGEKLSPVEIASGLMTGLNMTGVVKPPALGDIPVGGGPPQMTQGTGLFGSTYGQTQAALNVAAAGDAKGAALSLLGPQAVKAAIDKVPDDRILNVLQKDDVQAGLNKVVERVAGGAEFDEALAYGLGTYIKEGGGLNIEGTDVSLGVIEDVVRDIVRPIGKAGTALADFVEEAMPDIDTSALDPIEKAIRETGRTAEDIVRAGGKAIDKSIIQPTREVAKALDDAVTQPVGDALSALDTAIRQALPDIDLPSVDLPSMDLPFDLRPSLVSDTGEDFISSPTRTTDSLFNDELFQFETEIGISDYPIELQGEELELFYPESAPQLDYAPDYDNFFENTIYEAKPRSYDF